MIQSIFTAICAITPNARYCRLNATSTGASIYLPIHLVYVIKCKGK